MPAGTVHRVVRQYLLHYGYADTLQAFDAAAGLADLQDSRWGGQALP